MKKLEKVEAVKNVGSSWLGLAVNIAVGIFLSPFILHRLGDEAFGLWVLIFSITGYYGLFDFGIRSSIVRYVSKFAATRDETELSRLVNTSVFSYTCIGLLAMAVTITGTVYVDRIFHIPPDFLRTAQYLFLMVGSSVSLGFPLGVYGGILEGLQKFYFLNLTNVVQTLLRAVLIVVALHHGRGLLTVALITVALPLLTSLLRAMIVLRLLPLRYSFRYVDGSTFRQMANYSGVTFTIIVASKLRFKTDALVIGAFLSSAAITYFSIGSRLVDYASEIVSSLAQIFAPMSSQSDATGDMDRLRKIFVGGNRACAMIIFPITAGFIILGKSVIAVWVGQRYVAASYPILLILLVPTTLMLAQATSSRVLFGMGKHGKLALVLLLEGAANLALSIVLVRPYGIIGDAIGTALPLTLTSLFFLPQHLCRVLGIRVRTFLKEAYLLPLALVSPMVLVLLFIRHWYVAHNLWQLAIQALTGAAVYGLCLFGPVRTESAWKLGELSPQNGEGAQPSGLLVETYQEET